VTDDSLEYIGVNECSDGLVRNKFAKSGLDSSVELGLAVCNSLEEEDGEVSGLPLELDMYQATPYNLESCETTPAMLERGYSHLFTSATNRYGILQRYPFDPALQSSSVLVEDYDSHKRWIYVKGSPEAISDMCSAASIPSSYKDAVFSFTSKGLYVIALARKIIPTTPYIPARKDLESNLTFLGFIAFVVCVTKWFVYYLVLKDLC